MHPVRLPVIIFALLFISACASVKPAVPEAKTVPRPEPSLIEALPGSIETFKLQGYKFFEDDSGGYSVRYSNERKRRLADIYIYPVTEENKQLAHIQLVLGSTRATMLAIGEAAKQGHYDNLAVINAATRAQGMRTVARVQATYLRQNLASFTLVYQSEHEGTLMKVRLSMPDNESNRSSAEWDRFADTVFKAAIKDLRETPAE